MKPSGALKVGILFCATTMLSTPASSATVRTIVPDTGRCTSWTELRAERSAGATRKELESWVLGYISAAAVFSHVDILRKSSWNSIFQEIDTRCKLRPEQGLPDVLEAVITEIVR